MRDSSDLKSPLTAHPLGLTAGTVALAVTGALIASDQSPRSRRVGALTPAAHWNPCLLPCPTKKPLTRSRRMRATSKVEKWTKDGTKVDHMLYAGSNLDKAQAVFAAAIKHRPRIRLTIRQRSLVLEQWSVSAP